MSSWIKIVATANQLIIIDKFAHAQGRETSAYIK